MRSFSGGLVACVGVLLGIMVGPASGQEVEATAESGLVERVEVRSRADDAVGIASSATEGATGREDLKRRPLLRSGEIVETVPGLIATQHSGGGKGNQYFLRGFNLDHGTDLALWVGGVPVNMPTHGHGQGYADLNFLIPELIDHVAFRKGPYRADDGDFSAAGSVRIEYVDRLEDSLVVTSAGGDGFARILVADSVDVSKGVLLGAVEYGHSDGPWERPDDFRKLNAVVRYVDQSSTQRNALTFSGYDGSWSATDQIPLRAIESGLVGRYAGLDPHVGGSSGRYSLAWDWSRLRGATVIGAGAYAMHYDLDLVSNFTYVLDDPENGDEFLQRDDRWVWGAHLRGSRPASWGTRDLALRYGVEARYDAIANGLLHSVRGEATDAVRKDRVDQLFAGAWAEAEMHWTPWLRTLAGLRTDLVHAHVESDLRENSGSESDEQVSPKLSVALGPWRDMEIYLNYGRGFHSNDARGATIRVDPASGEPVPRVDFLVRATGFDLGIRSRAIRGLQSTLTCFQLEMDSELLFIGDAGNTEASRPSRRRGIEWTNFYRVSESLALDLDVALTRPRFRDRDSSGDHIPGAIEEAVAAGVTLGSRKRLGAYGSLRWRYFGPRSLVEDDSVRSGSTSLVNARVGWTFDRGLHLSLDVFNLLNREDSDIAYYYESRLPGEPAEGVPDIHIHPMEKRTIRLVATWQI